MPFGGWRKCAVWVWTPRSRSLLKLALLQQPFPLRNVSPRRSVLAPGNDESAGVNYSHRSPQGNRTCDAYSISLLTPPLEPLEPKEASSRSCIAAPSHAWDTIKPSGSIAHRLCRLIWLILHHGVRFEERGPAVTKRSKQLRTWKMIRQLRNLGYRIELPDVQ
jgi:hypothetical protein